MSHLELPYGLRNEKKKHSLTALIRHQRTMRKAVSHHDS